MTPAQRSARITKAVDLLFLIDRAYRLAGDIDADGVQAALHDCELLALAALQLAGRAEAGDE